jgi:uncharacterized tellurite resistance protein B-like protein
MPAILGFLGTIVTILWLLYRLAEMGIDLGGLNPFLWRRRRKWKKHYEANPIFKIDSPLEATALLITATAKADGDMSSEEKKSIIEIFEKEFHLSQKDAAALLISSSHLLGKGNEIRDNLKAVLAPSLANFTASQASSAIQLLEKVARVESAAGELKQRIVKNATAILNQVSTPKSKWE